MSETKMVIAAIEELNRLPDVLAFRNNTGQARIHGFRVRFGLGNGSADVIAVLAPWGHLIGLEGKKPGEGADEAQLEWAQDLIAVGGTYRVFHTIPEALGAVQEIRAVLWERDWMLYTRMLSVAPPQISARAKPLSTLIDCAQPTVSVQSPPRRKRALTNVPGSMLGQPRPAPESSTTPIVGKGGTHGK